MATKASNVTENIGLSQWSADDEFRREDFNADNLAIDAAFGAVTAVATGTYTGTGTYGAANPCTLNFPFTPKLVMIYEANMGMLGGYGGSGSGYSYTVIGAYGCSTSERYSYTSASNVGKVTDNFTWGESSVSWYTSGGSGGKAQLNESGVTYHYLAIG